jgi:hypothetical protein
MDGLSRWDLVLWIIVGYVAVMAIVRMILYQRNIVVQKLRQQLAGQRRRKPAVKSVEESREAA